MTIKIPYTYRSYNFSKKATKYSQNLARWKLKINTVFIGILTWFVLIIAVFAIMEAFYWSRSSDAEGIAILAATVASVYVAIQIKKIILAVYTDKLVKELEAEAKKAEATDPALAIAIRNYMIPDVLGTGKPVDKAQ